MPIDYKKLSEVNRIENQLDQKVAIINTYNSSLTPAEKIATVELLTGKTLQSKQNPAANLLNQQKQIDSLAPVLRRIDALKNEIQEQTGMIEQHAIQQPVLNAITSADTGIDLYTRHSINAEAREYYNTHPDIFPDLNKLAIRNNQERIRELLIKQTSLSKSLGAKKGRLVQAINRLGDVPEDMIEAEGAINEELKHVAKYKKTLKKLKIGAGIAIGDYIAPRKRLKRDNILSVRYAKNPSKIVPAFGATRVSNGVKQVLMDGVSASLSESEKDFLDKLFVNAGQTITPAISRTIRGSGVFTSMKEIFEKVQVLLGEIKAGNTSISLRNELTELLHYLYKHKKVKKAAYTNLIQSLSSLDLIRV